MTSSTCEVTVRPSTKSWNFTKPATSVTTGWVCGSQVATTWPPATVAPSLTLMIGAVGDLVALALAAEVIDHADLARARHRHQVPLLVLHGLDVMEADHALVAHLDAAGRRRARGRAADVEGAHGELRARLADRLRGDDAHRLADGDRPAARQIAPVAVRAHAVARLAGDRRAHLDLVDALGLEQPHQLLIEQRAGRDQHLLGARLDDVLAPARGRARARRAPRPRRRPRPAAPWPAR